MSSLLRIEQQQKKIFQFTSISKSLSSLSSSFGIEYVLLSKTIPNSRPKWAKSIPVFRPKPLKNHTLWGSTYLYGLIREYRELHIHQQNHWNEIIFYWYQSYHWYQWTIGLTNRICLWILDMCEKTIHHQADAFNINLLIQRILNMSSLYL